MILEAKETRHMLDTLTDQQLCDLGSAVIATETQAIQALGQRMDTHFAQACRYLLACEGRVVVLGIGKSGHIGSKLAATLASTGSPAFFVHPGEASHGDMGMITRQDVVIAISYSGETQEILTLLPLIKRLDIPLISLSGQTQSSLAQAASVNLNVHIDKEACPLNLAPTASTTATLVMGDALAVALLQARGFTAEDFARSHPGGNLGRRLLLRVDDLAHTGDALPCIYTHTLLRDALLEMTEKKLGMTTIINKDGTLAGIFTDGDLRRALDKNSDVQSTPIIEVMTKHCRTLTPGTLAVDALTIMEKFKITSLVVVNEQQKPIGVLHMHSILSAGIL